MVGMAAVAARVLRQKAEVELVRVLVWAWGCQALRRLFAWVVHLGIRLLLRLLRLRMDLCCLHWVALVCLFHPPHRRQLNSLHRRKDKGKGKFKHQARHRRLHTTYRSLAAADCRCVAH